MPATLERKPLTGAERERLVEALRGNSEGGLAILMNSRDTSFAGVTDEVPDEEVISAIKSIPCHY